MDWLGTGWGHRQASAALKAEPDALHRMEEL